MWEGEPLAVAKPSSCDPDAIDPPSVSGLAQDKIFNKILALQEYYCDILNVLIFKS